MPKAKPLRSAPPNSPNQKNEAPSSARRYLLPALVAFVFRVEWMLILGTYALYRGNPLDGWLYGFEMGSVARSLTHGLGYSSPFDVLVGRSGPTAWVTPLYPLLIAAATKVFGSFSLAGVLSLMTLNCAFSAATCIPIYLIAEETFGRRVAWLAIWMWALVPYFNRWHFWLWDISLSALLLAAMFWLTLCVARNQSWRWELALGVVTGLAALSNPALLSFLPVSLVWIAWRRWKATAARVTTALRPAAVAILTIAVMATPWIVRNRLAFGQWVFLRTNFGAEFYLTNQHNLRPAEWLARHPSVNWYEGAAYRSMGELAYNHSRMAQAIAYIKQYPGEFARTSLNRSYGFWSGSFRSVFSDDDTARFRFYVPLSVLGLLGLVLALVRKRHAALLYLGLLVLYPSVYYITYPITRQRHAIEPLLAILAAAVLVGVYSWLAAKITAAGGPQPSRRLASLGWAAVATLLVVCAIVGADRAATRTVLTYAPRPILQSDRFIQVCGIPNQETSFNNVIELDYQRAKRRVRIIDSTWGWVYDRDDGTLLMPAQSLGCWKKNNP